MFPCTIKTDSSAIMMACAYLRATAEPASVQAHPAQAVVCLELDLLGNFLAF